MDKYVRKLEVTMTFTVEVEGDNSLQEAVRDHLEFAAKHFPAEQGIIDRKVEGEVEHSYYQFHYQSTAGHYVRSKIPVSFHWHSEFSESGDVPTWP